MKPKQNKQLGAIQANPGVGYSYSPAPGIFTSARKCRKDMVYLSDVAIAFEIWRFLARKVNYKLKIIDKVLLARLNKV